MIEWSLYDKSHKQAHFPKGLIQRSTTSWQTGSLTVAEVAFTAVSHRGHGQSPAGQHCLPKAEFSAATQAGDCHARSKSLLEICTHA